MERAGELERKRVWWKKLPEEGRNVTTADLPLAALMRIYAYNHTKYY